jgi:tetratricopeptide (TPR) repeat protein
VHKEIPDNHFVTFKIAELYHIARDPKNAVEYYKYVTDPSKTEYPEAMFHYGECLKQLGRYDEAKIQFTNLSKYKEGAPSDQVKIYKEWSKNEIRSCNYAQNLIDKDTAFVNIEIVGGEVNKAYTDFSPLQLGDTLVFASLRQDSVIAYKYEEEKNYPVKLYHSVKQNNIWSMPTEYWDVNVFYEMPQRSSQ